jgi:nicotinamidase-related amidase
MTYAYQSFPTIEPILVCLDLQQDQQIATSPADRERRRRCIETCQQVLAQARRLQWKVAHVHFSTARVGPLAAGSKPIAGLEPRPSEPIFYRQGPSAFSSGAFQEFLKRIAAPQLILVGFSLDGSALFTAMSAQEAGVPVSIVQGAVDAPPMGLLGSDVVESVLLGVVRSFTEVLNVDELFERAASPYVGHAANLP